MSLWSMERSMPPPSPAPQRSQTPGARRLRRRLWPRQSRERFRRRSKARRTWSCSRLVQH
eukprot:scaffold980_cov248-Pinguiococcus_pyrenoidosus.AAC.10